MSINKKILDFIKMKGIAQADLAKKMKIAPSNLNRILNSDDLKISQLVEISKILKVNPTHFFEGESSLNNKELESYKNRITELEKIIKDKEHYEFEKFYGTVKEILFYDKDFGSVEDKLKERIIIYISEAYGKSQLEKIIYDVSVLSKQEIKMEIRSAMALIKKGDELSAINNLLNDD